MKDIILFHKILLPIDFNDNSLKALTYATNLCQSIDAELVLLYTYRLIDKDGENNISKVLTTKENIKKEAEEKFLAIEKNILNNYSFKRTFLSEVGFISDRIQSNIVSEKDDLVVLSEDMLALVEKELNDVNEQIVNKIKSPILIIPN